MKKFKRKTVKGILMYKGEKVEYQTLIEETIGSLLSTLHCYGLKDDENSQRAYLYPDCDYEIIIRPKK